MLYTIEEYLKRESTGRLETFVADYYKGVLQGDYSTMIALVEEELRRRKKELQIETKKT